MLLVFYSDMTQLNHYINLSSSLFSFGQRKTGYLMLPLST